MKNVYVIIVTYNGIKWIDKCCSSLQNSQIPLTVLIIDNSSTDGTPNVIRDKYPEVQLIETGENLGFGKGNNIGLRIALECNADYVFLLNQDAYIKPDTIKRLIDVAEQNKDFGILSPIHLNGTDGGLDLNFSLYVSQNGTPGFLSDLYLKKASSLYKSFYVNAAAWLIPIQTIKIVGLFNPIFPHYGEDTDYLERLKYHQLQIGIVPFAEIIHDRNQVTVNSTLNYNRIKIHDYGTLLNLNEKFIDAYFNWVIWKMSLIFLFLYKLRFKLILKHLSSMFLLIIQSPYIYYLRKKTKLQSAFIK